ncbi:hypothetical protein SK128_016293, partial [Halocaridina rubra]
QGTISTPPISTTNKTLVPPWTPQETVDITTELPTQANVTSLVTRCSISRAYYADCGIIDAGKVETKIVNGYVAEENEFPYHVAVMTVINNRVYRCGGSIIKSLWVLTAAHCFFDPIDRTPAAAEYVSVAYGSSDLYDTNMMSVAKYIIHENYSFSDHGNDIALVELMENFTYETDPTIQPVCIGVEGDIPYGGKAVATGWGALSYGGSNTNVLQRVTLDVIDTSQCASMYYLPEDESKVICTLTPSKDTCQGDSGGPLVVQVCPNQWVQIGVVSYGYKCAEPNKPGVYMKVSAFRTWIDINTESQINQ